MQLFPYCLVIVDMQPRFAAANDVNTQNEIIRLVMQARRDNAIIIVLEYYNRFRDYPPSQQRTVKCIRDAYADYPHAYTVEKMSDDGSDELLETLREICDEPEDMSFKVCGVNWGACVEATIVGMVSDHYIDGGNVQVFQAACNQPTYWSWGHSLQVFQSFNVSVV